MISVLVVDDNNEKAQKIKEILIGIPEVADSYEIVPDLSNARKCLTKQRYDLLLLDLQLPQRYGDEVQADSGVNFLKEINQSARLIKPLHIVGLSAHNDLIKEFKDKFDEYSWSLINYVGNENSWQLKIKNKINYLIDLKRSFTNEPVNYQYDIAIITALAKTELEAVLRLGANWERFKVSNDATEYYRGIFKKNDKNIRVVAAACSQMGMVSASVLTTKLIEHFRPKYIAMTGIAAGIESKSNYGDVLIADISFDSGSGKITVDRETKASKFMPDPKSIPLVVDLKEQFNQCIMNRDYVDDIYREWPSVKPKTVLEAHVGPFASGAGVVEDTKIIQEIQGHTRKLIGVDMEVYGVFYAAHNCSKPRPLAVMAIKSVSDFANPEKDDVFQNYAAYTSASYLHHFILDKLDL